MDAGEPLTPHEQIKVISESKLIPLPKTKKRVKEKANKLILSLHCHTRRQLQKEKSLLP